MSQAAGIRMPSEYEFAVLAHARHYSKLMAAEGPRLNGDGSPGGQNEALAILGADRENIAECFDRLCERVGDSESADLLLPVAHWLQIYYEIVSGYSQMEQCFSVLCERLGRLGRRDELLLEAILSRSIARWRLAHISASGEDSRLALELAEALGNGRGIALALGGLARVEAAEGNLDKARALVSESLARLRMQGVEYSIASALNNLGNVEAASGNFGSAQSLHAESLAIKRRIGDRYGIATTLNNLGNLMQVQGFYAQAQELLSEAISIRREIDDRSGIAASLNNLGKVEHLLGNNEEACRLFADSLEIRKNVGDRYGVAQSLNNLGTVNSREGNFVLARSLLTESLALRRDIGARPAIAGVLDNLGLAECKSGDFPAARRHFAESLEIYLDCGDEDDLCLALAGGGCVLSALGQMKAAQICLGGALHYAKDHRIRLEADFAELADKCLRRIGNPVGGITPPGPEASTVSAEPMSLRELAVFCAVQLHALETSQAGSDRP